MFKSYIDTRLDSLVGSLQSSSTQQVEDKEGIRASNSKLQREAEASRFKYKANAKQFLHNAEVADLVGQAIEQLQKENPNHVQALEFASRALASILKGQKLIKLADKSEAGWLAVDEYERDELADDSEDDKKIRRGQDKAVRKREEQKTANKLAGLKMGSFFEVMLSFFLLSLCGSRLVCQDKPSLYIIMCHYCVAVGR